MRLSKFVIAKYLLIFINLSYALLGAAMLAVGLAQKESVSGHLGVLYGSVTLWAPMLLICTGTVLFLVAILGSLATLAENYWALVWFGTFLGCTILIQSVAGAASLIISGNITRYLHNAIEYEVLNYEHQPFLMDQLQLELNCCGERQFMEYKNLFGCVPSTCCPEAFPPPKQMTVENTSETNSATAESSDDRQQPQNAIFMPRIAFHYWPPTKPPKPITESLINRIPDKPFGSSNRKDIPKGKFDTREIIGGGHFVDEDDKVVDKMDDSVKNHREEDYDEVTTFTNRETTDVYAEPVLDIEAGRITRGPLLDWSDMLFRGLRTNGQGQEDKGRAVPAVIDQKSKVFRAGGHQPKSFYRKARFCNQKGRYCPEGSKYQVDGCVHLAAEIASDDAMLAGVAALVMASLQLIGIPLCIFMVSFIKELSRHEDRIEILTGSTR